MKSFLHAKARLMGEVAAAAWLKDMATYAGLKVKAVWLRAMQAGEKEVEVRSYLPSAHTPRGHAPVREGQRLFLLCNGFVWGSAVLGEVTTYASIEALSDDDRTHHILASATPGAEVGRLRARCAQGKPLHAWHLRDFRWFPEQEHPVSGERGVPPFKGQAEGQVWCRRKLPAALDVGTQSGA